MQKKENVIDLSLGFEPFKIRFADVGDEVEIWFNPADADLPRRFSEMREKVISQIETVNDFNLKADGSATIDANAARLESVRKVICDAVDHAFGNSISEKLFSHCSPFAICGGKPFVVQFLEKVLPQIERRVNEQAADFSHAAKKYLEKYE